MSKIYYENQYIKEIETDIVKINEKEGKYLVQLKDDIFFPGGGGQSRDYGTIDGIEVTDILEDGESEIYILNKKPKKLDKVKCIINWPNRLDFMQQHLAQHVLSGCFFSRFNANTAGIHLGKEISYVDIVGDISKDKISEAEKEANDIIHENRKVSFILTDRDTAQKMGLRRKLQTDDNKIRVVQIENLDINACCGVHPSNTFDLQMIKIVNHEKHKGNTRIFFMAGKRAINYSLNNLEVFSDICIKLSAGVNDINRTINNLVNDNKELKEEKSKIEDKLSAYEIQDLIDKSEVKNNYKIIIHLFEDYDKKYLNKIINKIIQKENYILLLSNKVGDKVSLLYACSKNIACLDMNMLLKNILNKLNGKGGGSKTFAQGIISEGSVNNVKDILNLSKRFIYENIQ